MWLFVGYGGKSCYIATYNEISFLVAHQPGRGCRLLYGTKSQVLFVLLCGYKLTKLSRDCRLGACRISLWWRINPTISGFHFWYVWLMPRSHPLSYMATKSRKSHSSEFKSNNVLVKLFPWKEMFTNYQKRTPGGIFDASSVLVVWQKARAMGLLNFNLWAVFYCILFTANLFVGWQ